jgi:cell division protein FtsN
MAGNKHDKPGAENGVSTDTGEVFEKLYREELDALEDDQQEKAAPKPGTTTGRVLRKKVVYHPKVEASKKVAPKTDATNRKVIKKKPTSAVGRDAPEEVSPKKGAKMKKIEMDKTGSQPKIGGGFDKIKIAVLCVVLVAAVAFIINSLGIVDFGSRLGFSEPTKKEKIKPRVAKKPPAKTDKKTTPVARKSPQKRPSRQAPNKATSQKRRLIVKKPPQPSPSKAQPRTVKKSPKPTTTAKKPVITQQRYRPATPTKKPTVVQRPPKPAAHTQKKGVSGNVELAREERIYSYPYSVYLGSYPSRERADKAISGYGKKGLSPYWVKVDLGDKGMWYRVFTGHFENEKSAEQFIIKQQLSGAKVKKPRYTNLLGSYDSEEELNAKKLALSGLGYCPYVINGVHGESLLYTGAFYQRRRAEQQQAELASKGITCEVVER